MCRHNAKLNRSSSSSLFNQIIDQKKPISPPENWLFNPRSLAICENL